MARQTATDKRIDRAITASYTKHAAGRQIDIMKIGQVYRDARAALAAGQPLDEAMPAIVARHCEAL